jgi:pantothenate kinase
MKFPNEIIVTGQQIDISHFSDNQKKFVADFITNLLKYYRQSGKERIVVGIAGPSGAGKSLLAALAKELSSETPVIPVSIDAFHFTNLQLENTKGGDGITLKDRKGRYDTYDVAALEQKLQKFTDGEKVTFPEYSRIQHEPISEVLIVPDGPCILLLEGLWLLYENSGWEQIHRYFAHTYFLDDAPAALRAHTILRHIHGGRSQIDAERHYDTSDVKNYQLLMQTKASADEQLTWLS